MPLPYEPIESDTIINVPNPPVTNGDLPVTRMPILSRIGAINLIGPSAANRQHISGEKRTMSLLGSVQRMAEIAAAIDTTYVRRDGTVQKGGLAGFTANIPLGGRKFTGAGNGTATGDSEHYGLLVPKAPINNPIFTGIPTAPTAAPGTNTSQIATTAFVHAGFAGA